MGDGTVDRRRFIGLGLAASGAAVLGSGTWTARASLRWEATEGFPGRPNSLQLEAPDLPEGADVEVIVSVHGPDPDTPRVELQRVRARVVGGEARIEAALTYPYAARVPGGYRYVGQVSFGGAQVATAQPAVYAIRPWWPLS